MNDPLIPKTIGQKAKPSTATSPPEKTDSELEPAHLAKYFVGGILVVVLIFGFFVWWGSTHEPITDAYNFFEFTKAQDLWMTTVQIEGRPLSIPFYYHPRELVDIPVAPGAINRILNLRSNGGDLVIALDPDAGATPVKAAVQISRLTGERFDVFHIPTSSALTRPDPTVEGNLPTANCANATETHVVLYITVSDWKGVTVDGHCVLLAGRDANETVRVADRFGYALLGIMPP